jgi:ATP-dependent HslUV protease ATP-binding subunit HslU
MRPSNILVHGRSGSGKTEIFRRISSIYNAPFIRVEATKYTEVGYHGDDVTNIVSDLFKKTQAEMANKDGMQILKSSPTVKAKVDEYILKCVVGPSYAEESRNVEEKREQLNAGLLEDFSCFLYVPGDKKYTQQIAQLKVKDIRKYMFEVYMEELFKMIDMEKFIKEEIEGKGIIVIDEIDKLVRSPDTQGSTKASDEGV